MPDDPRVSALLDELLDSHATPEEVCRASPELLPEVREHWQRVCRVRAELDAMFPTRREPDVGAPDAPQNGAALPRVPGYDVEAVLGRGGMGVVYRARHLRLGRVVALKMLLADAYAGPPERERFQREAEAIAGLRHPNIVQVYDVGESYGRPYFTMEFVDGGSLAEKLGGSPQPPHQAAALLATVAAAVHAAHTGGIVHRDLKPANVLLAADGTPKVSDFGIARRLDERHALTRTGVALGTPSYMAPEQTRGQGRVIGVATDVYALGALLYELLTGRPPFRAGTEVETLHQVVSQEPVPPSRLNGKVPRDLETICLKCLQKDAGLRYPGATALADDLRRFLHGEAISARPEHWAERLVRRARRRPVLTSAVAAATLLTAALLGGGLWVLSEHRDVARWVAAEQEAAERAAGDDLGEMARCLQASSWAEATAARERARGRLGDRGRAELAYLLDEGARELALAARLDAIRLNGSTSTGGVLALQTCDAEYEREFRKAGLGAVHDDAAAVAARIGASNIRIALLEALDHWSECVAETRRKNWILKVARDADRDATAWRVKARDPDVRGDAAAVGQLIATASITEQSVVLLLALERCLSPTSPDHVPFLKRVQRTRPGDFWVNVRLGNVLLQVDKPREAVGYYRAALTARPGAAQVRSNLGGALIRSGQGREGVEEYREAVRLDQTAGAYRLNLCAELCNQDRYDEALEQLPAAVRLNPDAAILRTAFGICLEAKGRHDEAYGQHREAVGLDPKRLEAQTKLRGFLMRRGRMTEARATWRAAIDANPLDHAAHYGYAEFCLFLGQEGDYRLARQVLLSRFGAATDPYVAERTARACLLLPMARNELQQAVALADRTAAVDRTRYAPASAHFLFVRGLADYRQGRLDQAIAAMRGDAGRVLGPAPRLVLAMALHQSDRVAEARQALAAAVTGYDWRTDQACEQDAWICHILRREAGAMIRANPSAVPVRTTP
ncbi:protein kinase [bacterium]|nr:protein kinase [bacterium]